MSHGPFHQEEGIVTTRTFVDTLGRVVQIPCEPQRLVSLVPSITADIEQVCEVEKSFILP